MDDRLNRLEEESVYIIREAYAKFTKPGMLWSIGKDSTVLLWLARKAFLGRSPIPLVHIDTAFKIPEMIKHRDRLVREWGLQLIIGRNDAALQAGMGPEKGRLECCTALKTEALRQTVKEHGFDVILLGIRRDEERSRSKERVFSARNAGFEWKYKEQPPEIWNQYNTDFPPGSHVRVHPLLAWTEVDIWEYIEQEKIPVVTLYFARNGKRYRSLGCWPCTAPIDSEAATVKEIIAELKSLGQSERAGRAQDQANAYAMQKLRAKGYM
ncbi:phosphoadenosine phosphosulphate reductase [Lucifera butyrica]|uniref:Sulfate adenylyltransferase subunit 2 n=1 Tax=Lucifera butyrica TaxID=1351585 RepID=A0A498RCJ7_9FIRM|nr:sulfate adenylyltransferase subunit CysD [Lucifera butyrica]VBB08979.1 phosphoadenosine phosphosulphate reductase [Lucifera butyrica]